ncbi:MAG: TlpA family protein disulfide reductase [Deltaproteobacteria bacterium]|nr:TlpA family protein disulfide reductase [Deltaproteobacteria bacterium]MBW1953053.1 TlpA family protein disulfide reductase [Deltaproteobacteria bacterium]MBW1985929.1 TlpA family protein disulfide reductase [Deltaproteobacteria bacterium]MBW2133689.1 TlpA family protein disulfide reductase [Deltaproteobacteria bacterium]
MKASGVWRRSSWILCLALLGLLTMSSMIGAAGKMAPDFSLPDIQGKSYTLSQLKGKVVLLNFFTIWCMPCREEMPDLNAIYKEYQDKGLEILGICLKADPNQLRFFVKKMNLEYPVLNGTEQVNKDYGEITGVPTTFIINKNGNIVHEIVGARDKAEFLSLIEPLL